MKKMLLLSTTLFFMMGVCNVKGAIIVPVGETTAASTFTDPEAITVESGGTLVVDRYLPVEWAPLTISGTGNGENTGALRSANVPGTGSPHIHANIIVGPDGATVNTSDSRLDLWGNISGGVLTKKGSDSGNTRLALRGDASGSKIVSTEGITLLQGDGKVNPLSELEITGGSVLTYDIHTITGNLKLSGGSFIAENYGNVPNKTCTLTGDVLFTPNAGEFRVRDGLKFIIDGNIGDWEGTAYNFNQPGTGTLTVTGKANIDTFSNSGNATFEGATKIKTLNFNKNGKTVTFNGSTEITTLTTTSGSVMMNSTGNLGTVNLNGGSLTIGSDAVVDAAKLWGQSSSATGTLYVDGTATFATNSDTHRLGHWSSHTAVIRLQDGGNLVMNGTTSVGWDGTGKFYQSGNSTSQFNTLNISGAKSLIEISGGNATIGTLNLGVRSGGSTTTFTGDAVVKITNINPHSASTLNFEGNVRNDDPINNFSINNGVTVNFKENANIRINNLTMTGGGKINFMGTADTNETIISNIKGQGNSTMSISEKANIHVTGNARFGETYGSAYTVNVRQSGGVFTVDGDLALGHYQSTVVYDFSGGELNVLNYDSGGQSGLWMAVNGDGTLNQSGGTINVGRMNLNARDASNKGTYTMTGGTLNVGAGGIMATQSAHARYGINLENGTISSLPGVTSWTGALRANLTGVKTDTEDTRVVFAPGEGQTIQWTWALMGDGGLIKDADGTLNLTGIYAANSSPYQGGTLVKKGRLQLSNGNNSGYSQVGTGLLEIAADGNVTVNSTNAFGHTSDSRLPEMLIFGTLTTPSEQHVKDITLKNGNLTNTHSGVGLRFAVREDPSPQKITSYGESTINSKITINGAELEICVAKESDELSTLTLSQPVSLGAGTPTVRKTGAVSLKTSSWINIPLTIEEGDVTITNGFGGGTRFNGGVTIMPGATLFTAAHDSLGYGNNQQAMHIYGTLDNTVRNETLANVPISLYGGTLKSTSGGYMDIYGSNTDFNAKVLPEATVEDPTVSYVDSKVRLRSNGFDINTDENTHLIFSESIEQQGAYGITKNGSGVLELKKENTYSGDTTATGGTIKLTGEGNLGSGGASLTATALDLVGKTGDLALNFFSLDLNSLLSLAINNTDGVLNAPVSMNITNAANLDGSLLLMLSGEEVTEDNVGQVVDILDFATTMGTFSDIIIDPDGNQLPEGMFFSYEKSTGALMLNMTVPEVPEPSTWILMILGMSAMMKFRRRIRAGIR